MKKSDIFGVKSSQKNDYKRGGKTGEKIPSKRLTGFCRCAIIRVGATEDARIYIKENKMKLKKYIEIEPTEEQAKEITRLCKLSASITSELTEKYKNPSGLLPIEEMTSYIEEKYPNTKEGEKDHDVGTAAIWGAIKEIRRLKRNPNAISKDAERSFFIKNDIEVYEQYFVSPELGKVKTKENLSCFMNVHVNGVAYLNKERTNDGKSYVCFYVDDDVDKEPTGKKKKFKTKLLLTPSQVDRIWQTYRLFKIAHEEAVHTLYGDKNGSKELATKVMKVMKGRIDDTDKNLVPDIRKIISYACECAITNPLMFQFDEKKLQLKDDYPLFAIRGEFSLNGITAVLPLFGKVRVKKSKRVVNSANAELTFLYSARNAFKVECEVFASEVYGQAVVDDEEDADE